MRTGLQSGMKWVVLSAVFVAACVYAQPQAEPPLTSTQVSMADVSRQAWQLASDGKLNEALSRVHHVASDATPDSPLFSLKRDIETYETHVNSHLTKSLSDYGRKMEKLAEQVKQDKLRDALQTALEAHDLAADPQTMLREPLVVELVERAEKRAAETEARGEWLKALMLYRGLGGLFESTNQQKYEEPLRRVAIRVGLLNLYAPRTLHEMQVKQAAEDGVDAPEPKNWEEERWQTRLEGITPEMLYEGMVRSKVQHVETHSFEQMIRGGIETLKLLVTVKGLESAFPSLADEQRTRQFTQRLDDLAAKLDARDVPLEEKQALELVTEALAITEQTLALPRAVAVKEFGEGAMGRLDDFTGFIWPHDRAQFDRTTTQRLSGVGIQIRILDGQLTVISPIEDSPAFNAGLRPGDKIVTIDGKSTKGIEIETAVDRITGPEETQVTLGILSPGSDKPRDVTLTRASIRIVSVNGWSRKPGGSWDYYLDPALKIGYVRLSSFGPDSAAELDAAIESLKQRGGIHGLVLDLRANPGGRLDAAIHITDRFLNEGTIVSTTQKSIFGKPHSWSANKGDTYDEFPMVVLVNRFSASASEILSGALKDHERALIVGERSFGKGSVQNIFQIGDRSAYLKLTIAYYLLPQGQIIHRRPGQAEWGVDPDVHIRMTDEQIIAVNRARSVLDILRKDGEEFDPSTVTSRKDNGNGQAPPETVTSADQILTRGMDPQLEAALLLLKTRVIADDVAMAHKRTEITK